MATNPLRYKAHLKFLDEYTEAARVASSHRASFLPYTTSQRILNKSGLTLSRTDYYNLHRDKKAGDVHNEFEALIHALDEAGFKYICRREDTYNQAGEVISRQIQQIWFSLDEQIQLAQRFVADFLMLADGTFSTNALNLTLIIMVGITNTGRSFPVSQSFARSEATVNFDFIFESQNTYIFTNGIPPPRVILSDQAPGMISSLPNHLPTTTLQFCDWHVQQNIKARLLKGRYTKDEREQVIKQFWQYCKAETAEQVTQQRFELTALLARSDVDYVLHTWGPKERQFLRLYTKEYPNLGCFANQRCESLHPSMKEILNPQLSLAEATRRLNTTIRQKIRALAAEEAESGNKMPRTLDRQAFDQLIDTISNYAVELIASEWEATKEEVDRNILTSSASSCTCELFLRFGLPCRHYLQDIYRNQIPIPRSLCHPRWWLFGPVIKFSNWKPTFNTTILPISPPRNQITQSAQRIIDLRDNLQGEAKARVDQAILQANAQIMSLAQQAQEEARLPTSLPEKVKKSGWRRDFKKHDKTTRRAMTAVETMEQNERQRERQGPAEISSDFAEETSPGYMMEVSPGPMMDSMPPASTAPAIIDGSRKRQRKHTTVYREAFGDSQEDPTAGIKRGKAGGIL